MQTASSVEDGILQCELPVLGMTCASCVRHVEKALNAVPGVMETSVNLPLGRATVRFRSMASSPAALAKAIVDAGYQVPDLQSARPGDLSLIHI